METETDGIYLGSHLGGFGVERISQLFIRIHADLVAKPRTRTKYTNSTQLYINLFSFSFLFFTFFYIHHLGLIDAPLHLSFRTHNNKLTIDPI